MTEKELIDAILTEHETMDNAEIDEACIRRLKHICDGYGREGDMARKMLDMVLEVVSG